MGAKNSKTTKTNKIPLKGIGKYLKHLEESGDPLYSSQEVFHLILQQ